MFLAYWPLADKLLSSCVVRPSSSVVVREQPGSQNLFSNFFSNFAYITYMAISLETYMAISLDHFFVLAFETFRAEPRAFEIFGPTPR